MKYSKSFQQAVIRMVLPPENKSIQYVSRVMGVSYQSIYNWIKLVEKGELLLNSEVLLSSKGQVEENKIELEINKWLNENEFHNKTNISDLEARKNLRITIKELQQENSRLLREKNRVLKKLRWNEKALSQTKELLELKLQSQELLNDSE